MAEKPPSRVAFEGHQRSSGQDENHVTTPTLFSQLLQIRVFNFTILITIPLVALILIPWVPTCRRTLALAGFFYFATMFSITGGYHRLWAHRSYRASETLKLLLALFGAAALQGSIKFWAREHRAHHRYTDTDRDPYNVKRGLIHSHLLWMILKQPKQNNRVDISDLVKDPVVAWQHSNYHYIAILMGWGLPAVIAGIGWGDWYGGLLYAGIIRCFLVHQATFCVNSLAHWLGDQPYDDQRSARDHLITAFITLGEGYHNFHHQFPSDYRNGIEWNQLDVTKCVILACEKLGLAHGLKRFRQNEIQKSRIQQLYRKLDRESQALNWGPSLSGLPIMDWNEYQESVQRGKSLILIEGAIHDISSFIDEHPGGDSMIRSVIGKDATTLFNGGVYNHSNTARNILSMFRVAVLRGGGEVEVSK